MAECSARSLWAEPLIDRRPLYHTHRAAMKCRPRRAHESHAPGSSSNASLHACRTSGSSICSRSASISHAALAPFHRPTLGGRSGYRRRLDCEFSPDVLARHQRADAVGRKHLGVFERLAEGVPRGDFALAPFLGNDSTPHGLTTPAKAPRTGASHAAARWNTCGWRAGMCNAPNPPLAYPRREMRPTLCDARTLAAGSSRARSSRGSRRGRRRATSRGWIRARRHVIQFGVCPRLVTAAVPPPPSARRRTRRPRG